MLRVPAPILLLLVADASGKTTFDEQVLPIFEQSCLNCHNPDKAKGGLDLSTYQGTMKGGSGGRIVEPGDPSSKLLSVVMRSQEPFMPPEGDAIPKDQIETLRAWIDGGLLQNPGSKARQPSKPKFDTALRDRPGDSASGPPPMPQDVVLEPAVVAERPSAIQSMVASPRAPLLAVTSQRQVLLFDTRSHELAGVLPFPEGDPVSLAITPDGRHLIVGGGRPGKSGLTATFDLVTGERVLTAAREFDVVLSADLRPDLSAVASGSPSKLVKLWSSADGSQAASIKKHTDWVTALDYSPDGILLATGDRNGGVWVWEALTGAEFHTLRAHQAAITAAAFRSDANLLATASEDGTVRFWEMNGGREVKRIDAHKEGVLAFAWAPDGGFATAGRERAVRLWKPDFGSLRMIKDLPDIPTAVAIDHLGGKVFTGDYQGRIHIHRIEDGAELGVLDNNPPSIATRRERIEQKLREADKDARAELLRQQRRWYRASLLVDSRSLALRAAELGAEAEAGIGAFRSTAREVDTLSNRLAGRRRERAAFRRTTPTDDPATAVERASVLALLDDRIESLVGEIDAAASQLAEQRSVPDRILPEADERTREAARLSALYRSTGDTGN